MLTLLWRFLDDHEHLSVSRLEDLTDIHGSALTLWLSEASLPRYRGLKTLVVYSRRYYNLPELFWPTIHDRDESSDRTDIEPTLVRAIFKALVTEAQQIKAMFNEGKQLAAIGADPRQGRRLRSKDATPWTVRENHAWLVRELAVPIIINRPAFLEQGASGLHQDRLRRSNHHVAGPSYLAPGHTAEATRGFVGKLRWFYPSLFDTIIFYLLFRLQPGGTNRRASPRYFSVRLGDNSLAPTEAQNTKVLQGTLKFISICNRSRERSVAPLPAHSVHDINYARLARSP